MADIQPLTDVSSGQQLVLVDLAMITGHLNTLIRVSQFLERDAIYAHKNSTIKRVVDDVRNDFSTLRDSLIKLNSPPTKEEVIEKEIKNGESN